MTSQLGQFLAATNLPTVTLGIIPTDAPDRSRWVIESFSMFDDSLLEVELATARVRIAVRASAGEISEPAEGLWPDGTRPCRWSIAAGIRHTPPEEHTDPVSIVYGPSCSDRESVSTA